MKLISVQGGQGTTSAAYLFEFPNLAQAVAWLRLVVYSALYFVFQLLQIRQSDFLSVSFWQPINLLMAAAFLAQLVLTLSLERQTWLRTTYKAALAVDILILGLFLSIWGVPHASFLFFTMVICAVAGLSLGLTHGLKLALWASIVYHAVLILSPEFQPEVMKTAWLVNNVSFAGVAVLGGLLGDQLKAVALDIEQKREEIQILSDVNELIVDNIPSGLLLLDQNFKVLKANRGAAKIFSDLALEGQELNQLSAAIYESLVSTQGVWGTAQRTEVVHYNYKKEKMILEVIFAPVRRSASGGQEIVCLVQNLTEIKQLESAMRQKEKLAAVGQLAAGIAHEIRNPLASISGSVQLLQANFQASSPEDKKLFNIVIREIDRLNNLITEFLDFVRPDVRMEDPISLNHMMREILDMAKVNKQLPQKVEQLTELRAQKIVLGHYDKLKQALLNIVINAYQAMSDTLRPQIFIQTYDKDDRVVLVIRDNGVGMTSDNIKRIFEPFHTTKPSGTGLGLAITHKILETHSAEISVESTLGQGAQFTLSFPVGQGPNSNRLKENKQAGTA